MFIPLSSSQIGVGLIPILVIVGWIINQDLTLFFECVSVLSLAVALERTSLSCLSRLHWRGLSADGEQTLRRNFETIVLFVSVLLVDILVADGKSNYLEGLMLGAPPLLLPSSCQRVRQSDAGFSLGSGALPRHRAGLLVHQVIELLPLLLFHDASSPPPAFRRGLCDNRARPPFSRLLGSIPSPRRTPPSPPPLLSRSLPAGRNPMTPRYPPVPLFSLPRALLVAALRALPPAMHSVDLATWG